MIEPAIEEAKPAVWPIFVTYVGVFIWLQAISLAVMVAGAIAVLTGQAPHASPDVSQITQALTTIATTPWFLKFASLLNIVTFVGVSLVACRVARQPARIRLRLTRPSGLAIVIATVGFAGISDAIQCGGHLLDLEKYSLTIPLLMKLIRSAIHESLPLTILLVGIVPGIGEELFFRGFIQTRLSTRWGSWPAILVTSALFGALHCDPVHTPVTFLMGLILGWSLERTGSLWVPIVAHAVNNTLSTLQAADAFRLSLPKSTELLLVSTIGLGALFLLHRQTRPSPSGDPVLESSSDGIA